MIAILFLALLLVNLLRWLLRKPQVWTDTPRPGVGYIGYHEINNKEIPY